MKRNYCPRKAYFSMSLNVNKTSCDQIVYVSRIQIVCEGKKRKLIIKNCKLDDGGMISAKTNSDEVSAPLEVNCKFLTIFFCEQEHLCHKL